jgi:VWFA-related protein
MTKISCVVCFCAAAVAASLGLAAYAQQSQPPSAPGPVVKAASEEMSLDVVVRDKKGHEVKDLKPEDFQIFDNGEAKTIKSFRLVEGKEAIEAGGARTPLDPLRQIRLLTMIFQFRSAAQGSTAPATNRNNVSIASDADARQLARDGAMDFLKQELPPNVYVAVMAIDHQLEVLQPYTNDPDLLRKAIDRVTKLQVTDFAADTERVRHELEQVVGSNPAGPSAPAPTNPAGAPVTAPNQSSDPDAPAKAVIAQMLLQTLNTEQSNAMTVPGRLEIFALLDAVKEQYRLPGRKTVLYFSEGFTIPQGIESAFDDLIGAANRSNVSFYIVDAHGLGVMNPNQANINELRSAGQATRDPTVSVGNQPATIGEAGVMEAIVQSTRSNYQLTFAHLAESTGGFLIANTNDLRGPIHRMTEDIQTYYELSYKPEISNHDGSFHKVAVKISSGDLRVQSRSGYSALPPSLLSAGTTLRPYEVSLLAALNSPQPPKAFDYESAGLYFRGLRDQPECDLLIDVPLANVTFQKSNAAGQVKGRLSYIALLKDEQGEVVKKFQNDIPLIEPVGRLEGLKANHFIYTEHFDLPPGHYALETAVLDGEGNRISARRSSVTIAPSSGLAISGVSMIRSAKERGASTADGDPLLLGTKLISPTLNPVISKASTKTLPFYLVIYIDKNVSAPPQLVMEFSRNGKVLGTGLPQLRPPDKDGRIQYVAMAPTERLEPGNFTVRFIVKQGSETAVESAAFTLQ